MVNHFQVLFLLSFSVVLVSLVTGFRWLQSALRDTDYDISKLILIGLDSSSEPASTSNMSQSVPAFLNIRESNLAQLVALALALASSAFIYLKFGRSKRKPVLDPKQWQTFTLVEKIVISPNTAIYRFALPHPEDVLGLPIGQHLQISAEINGKEIMRSYTPTSSDDDRGRFDLLIKAYEQGNISRHISLLKLGDQIRVKGPRGQFTYHGSLSRELGMIAGGTGITPMLQIIRAALKSPLDRTKLSLIYANVNPEDILLKKELDELAAAHPGRFKVYYVLNNPPAGWTGGVGFVTKEQIAAHLPPSDHNIKVLLCGPPPMMTAMKKYLDDLGYPKPRTVSKLEDQVFLF
ncbi:hypothetical protein EWM64_g6925 [Hericium alpestre]|uniref:NADH-cytochrome b5 reductase n=1 Tax=Hericium alpestre TaxID=135208 RepID=A0A4Y9ZU93_9AGAM|nr:hypothetical protein EWM64_g6925 [Hericium alpestre]